MTMAACEAAATGGKTVMVSHGDRRDQSRLLAQLLVGSSPGPDLDWVATTHLSRQHGLSSLLFWRLKQWGEDQGREDGVPAGVWEGLQRDFYAAAGRAMLSEWWLGEVVSALAMDGVPALVVKGAAVGAFYPDPALRSYSDLDIVVPQARLEQAETVLSGLGFRYARPRAWWLEYVQHLPPMVSQDSGIAVELHWRLDHDETPGRLPMEDLWTRVVPWSVGGQPALRLEAVDAVLHLCQHAVVQHRAKLGLRPLCDLAQMTAGWSLAAWETLGQRAIDYGLARPVYLMLKLAEEAGILAAPVEVMAAVRPPDRQPLPSDVVESFLLPKDGTAVSVPLAVVQAGARATLEARVRHFLWHLFLPQEGMAMTYSVPPGSLRMWLAYVWRPVDLLRRYGRTAWGMLRGERAARLAWQREAWLEQWLMAEEQQVQGGG